MIDTDIFGDVDKSKLRLAKPANGTQKQIKDSDPKSEINIRKLKPVAGKSVSGGANLFDNKLTAGIL
jgi:DNA helicase-2/ATP-dependent DNA helicase PcrA